MPRALAALSAALRSTQLPPRNAGRVLRHRTRQPPAPRRSSDPQRPPPARRGPSQALARNSASRAERARSVRGPARIASRDRSSGSVGGPARPRQAATVKLVHGTPAPPSAAVPRLGLHRQLHLGVSSHAVDASLLFAALGGCRSAYWDAEPGGSERSTASPARSAVTWSAPVSAPGRR
jgi:hypothetical protein